MKFLLAIVFTFTWWMPWVLSYIAEEPIKTSITNLGLMFIIIAPVLFLGVAIVSYTQGKWYSDTNKGMK